MTEFHLQGAVPIGSGAHVSRGFEDLLVQEVIKRRWLLVLGPRQHGKTSGCIRAMSRLEQEVGFTCFWVDLQRVRSTGDYAEYLELLVRALRKGDQSELEVAVGDRDSLFAWLEALVPPGPEPVVVFVDEASRVPAGLVIDFYSQIREIANRRATAPDECLSKRLIFVFSGTFQPETLIDELNSPFNVCSRIETDDLDLEGATYLANLGTGKAAVYAAAAFALVGGQPYLLQKIYSQIDEDPQGGEAAFSAATREVLEGRDLHFEALFETILGDDKLTGIARKMVADGGAAYEPANPSHKYMTVLGLARLEDRQLRFRNDAYRRIASGTPDLSGGVPQDGSVIYRSDRARFNFMTDAALGNVVHQCHSSAVVLFNAGRFRLALVAFGATAEGILEDWLSNVGSTVLSAAVTAASPTWQNFETPTDPLTWRLVNLFKVARKTPNGPNSIDPPEALREWRNLVHPILAKASQPDESKLKEEAEIAASLVAILIRDLG